MFMSEYYDLSLDVCYFLYRNNLIAFDFYHSNTLLLEIIVLPFINIIMYIILYIMKWLLGRSILDKKSFVMAKILDPLSKSARAAFVRSHAFLLYTNALPSKKVELAKAAPTNDVLLLIIDVDLASKFISIGNDLLRAKCNKE